MKNTRFARIRIAAAFVAAAILLATLLSLSRTIDIPQFQRITVLLAGNQSEYWNQVTDEIQQELGSSVSVQLVRTAPTDIDEQRKRFEMAIAADVNGMIVSCQMMR